MMKIMNEIYGECRGCKTIITCKRKPEYIYENHISKCPCTTCLVKTMCNYACILYDDHINHINANYQRIKIDEN